VPDARSQDEPVAGFTVERQRDVRVRIDQVHTRRFAVEVQVRERRRRRVTLEANVDRAENASDPAELEKPPPALERRLTYDLQSGPNE
jgi:hypothetical protein